MFNISSLFFSRSIYVAFARQHYHCIQVATQNNSVLLLETTAHSDCSFCLISFLITVISIINIRFIRHLAISYKFALFSHWVRKYRNWAPQAEWLAKLLSNFLKDATDNRLVTGVLLTGMLETVQQRLWDNFWKQTKEEQSLHYCHLMALSAALARCSSNGHARAADFHCQLILNAISNHFYSILRPKILSTTEMVSCQ